MRLCRFRGDPDPDRADLHDGGAGAARCPGRPALDLKDHYYRERLPFFGAGLAAISWSVLREVILEGRLPVPVNFAFHLVFITMSAIALLSKNERLHKAFAGLMSLMFVGYTAALFAKL